MLDFVILLRCVNGHTQSIKYPALSREHAEMFAGLLDGTSPYYKISPRDSHSTTIGRCASCKSQVDAKVEEISR